MADRPAGTIYWLDHYTIPTNDLDRSEAFHERVIGAVHEHVDGEQRERGIFQRISNYRQGLFVQRVPLPPPEPLGNGLPRHALFVHPEDIDEHRRRLDACGVEHTGPVRTSAYGEDGTSICWLDVDGNPFEFWASDRMPAGAMDDCGPLRIGRMSHGVYASRDLGRTAAFFERYCALQPLRSSEVPSDTLVLPLAAGGRLIFKLVAEPGQRTSGRGIYRDLHTALVVREEDFFPNYERMWRELPEWDYDQRSGPFTGDGLNLPARTGQHGGIFGFHFKDTFGRGDDWFDADTNLFHFLGGAPRNGSMTSYDAHPMQDYMDAYLAAHVPGSQPLTIR
jgi:hypothetical protein